MLNQSIKGWFLLGTFIFIAMAINNYFKGADVYRDLIVTAFLIHFFGCVVDYIIGWHFDRRKLDLTEAEKENWMHKRQAD